MTGVVLDIGSVERETGLSKDVLRVWERRYGFPKPHRDNNGERQYTAVDVVKLRAIKRLVDVGMRPGKVVGCTIEELMVMADRRIERRKEEAAPAIEGELVAMLPAHDAEGLQNALAHALMRQGLQRF